MKKRDKRNIITFFILLIAMGVNYVGFLYLPNLYMQIGLILITSIILVFAMTKLQGKKELQEIINYISHINDLDFNISQGQEIPLEAKEKIHKVYKEIRGNLKTQVEISTDILNICEELALSTSQGLKNAELIASSVDMADKNITEQSEMLKMTNELTNKIYLSMENIQKDVNSKIEFISNSITLAQNGIETIDHIENRIKNSKDNVEKNANEIIELRNYFDEVVGFVDLINKISNQTKMLSLNASIEAARAGEEGKGFAIVAMEVGKLAGETENVSKKIEEVIKNITVEINHISNSMEDEMKYMEENAHVIEMTNKEFTSIIDTLNLGKESLEAIKTHTRENTNLIEDINLNIENIFQFSNETTSQMMTTTEQALEQHNRAIKLNDVAEDIRGYVYNMQQFVVGKVMEEKMLKQAYRVKDYFTNNKNVNDQMIQELIREVGVDAIYITEPSGIVKYTNEKSALGLNLYEADPTFSKLKEENKEYIVTPIKKRVEDGKPFKFLTVTDEKGRLYEVGLGLYSLIKNI